MIARVDVLEADFYARPTIDVARDLLGKLIVRTTETGPRILRIVETEAYLPDDPASHSFRGPTDRNRAMFGPPGHAYVYLIYGMHHCLNVVTEPEGTGAAVLIRAALPLVGLEAMWRARFPEAAAPRAGALDATGAADGPDPRLTARLASGPGKLCRALDVHRDRENGVSLREGSLLLARLVELDGGRSRSGDTAPAGTPTVIAAPSMLEVVEDARIGISQSAEKPWRFTVSGSRFLSRKPDPAIPSRRHHPR